jgi:TRADD-N domain-containing protein
MTDTNRLKPEEAKVEQAEGTERGMSGGLLGLIMLGFFALLVVGGLGILLLAREQAIASSTQIVAALTTLFATVTVLVGTYFGIKASSDTRREIDRATAATGVYAEQLAKTKPANILEVAGTQTELLTGYYRTVLAQARESFRWALIAAGVGLLFFLGAVAFVLIVNLQSVATVSITSGALIEVISGINFYLYGRTTTQLATFHRRLDQTQRFLLANSVCESLEGEERQKARVSLVHTIADPTLGQ